MSKVMLSTSKEIINYISSLSDFIYKVKITSVEHGEFHFSIEVPFWYKFIFGKIFRKRIQKELEERLYIGVKFKFIIYSKKLF
jgi:hypothetical protein